MTTMMGRGRDSGSSFTRSMHSCTASSSVTMATAAAVGKQANLDTLQNREAFVFHEHWAVSSRYRLIGVHLGEYKSNTLFQPISP